VDCRADEAFAVFSDPRNAVAAALNAQRELLDRHWPAGAAVRIRMGVHTGVAQADERSDFVGLDVHRAARISSAAHGGQILVSERTAELVDAPLRDLGVYELPGLTERERLFQLEDRELPSEFPPPRSARRCDGGRIRVALADDSVLIREGIARLLEESGFDVITQAGTSEELMAQVEEYEPEIAVVDIRMPPSGSDEGLRAGQEIRRRFPNVGVLLLSQMLELQYALELLGADAERVGYLLKDRVSDVDEFTSALRRIAGGGCAFDAEIVSDLVERYADRDDSRAWTSRERELLALFAEGRSDDACAQRLSLPRTDCMAEISALLARIGVSPSARPSDRALAVLDVLVGRAPRVTPSVAEDLRTRAG